MFYYYVDVDIDIERTTALWTPPPKARAGINIQIAQIIKALCVNKETKT